MLVFFDFCISSPASLHTQHRTIKMNTYTMLLAFLLAVVAVVSSLPTVDRFTPEYHLVVDEESDLPDAAFVEEHGVRQKRATCDLLSISVPWGSLNHAACAAHCLAMRKGFRGGRCKDGVCHCRR